MAASQLLAPLPFMTLDTGCTITVEAIDPASGADVTGVTVSDVTFYGSTVEPGAQPGVHDPAFVHVGDEA